MNEVVNELEVAECLDTILISLFEKVAEEELLLRPPGLGDDGRAIRWVNHFGEVENVHVRSEMVANQDVVMLARYFWWILSRGVGRVLRPFR